MTARSLLLICYRTRTNKYIISSDSCLTTTTILEKANKAVTEGDNEGFLSFCTDDTTWNFIGDRILSGKQEVREWMKDGYKEPPRFTVLKMVADADHVIAMGTIQQKNEDGEEETYRYCDVWTFREGLMCGLEAFVIKTDDQVNP